LHPFEYVAAQSVDEAVVLLSVPGDGARIIAGGSDLLDEIKAGVIAPDRLISLSGISGLAGISQDDDHLNIGAMTTIADLAAHPEIQRQFTCLADAAGGLATPQIRNVGTLGGNLNQRPRCWYYRHPLTQCLKKGGDRCLALAGSSKYLCVTGGDRCYIVHPSDTAVALLALGASVEIAGPSGTRVLPIEEFYVGPLADPIRETALQTGELLTRVRLPRIASPDSRHSLYLKAREREAGDFALVSVAAAITQEGDSITEARVALGGVAPRPYRARQVEEYLQGRVAATVEPAWAGALALPDARPLPDNAYKVTLAQNMVKRAINQLLGTFRRV